jgi:hypothetical protein
VTPITKNVRVVRAGLPEGATYPRRARQLVRHGRAEWLDANTIRLQPDPPGERADKMETAHSSDATVAHFTELVEQILRDDELTKVAIAGIVEACKGGAFAADAPSHGIGRIMEANRQLKVEALKVLQAFVTHT